MDRSKPRNGRPSKGTLLLLSATPHQGKTDAFRRLMALLDDQAFIGQESIQRLRYLRISPYLRG